MSGYIKYFENGGKNMCFVIKDDNALDKYNEILDNIKRDLNIKFQSMPFYDEKYVKAKVRGFNDVIKTNFLDDKIQKESMHYTCIASVTIESVMKTEKKNYSQVYLEDANTNQRKYR